MCGLGGFFQVGEFSATAAQPLLAKMSALLSHRGPDDSGMWIDPQAGIALVHRRLSVVDLSAAGHQPMLSDSGRYVLVLNGEIYNYSNIRNEMDLLESPPQWRGHSDTEILLAAFERWGIEGALKKTIGMFALALWDRQERTLTLARDRLGEKPLYYGWQGDVFLFGSELKALRAHPAFRGSIDRQVLVDYFRRGYITAPDSIYEGILKLLPGSYIQLTRRDLRGHAPPPRVYWSLREAAARGLANPFAGSDEEAVSRLNTELLQAVAQQCVADVPLGAFLSGGIDSSTVVALMQVHASRPVKTFTIGFREGEYNEADHARSVARRLGTDHTELIVTEHEAMDVIPRLAAIYDEPFGDSSAIPTVLVSMLARRHVTVALSGDGGDELFGGYSRYQRTGDIWTMLRRVPYIARKTVSFGVGAYSRRTRIPATREKAARMARYLGARDGATLYEAQMAQQLKPDELVMRHGVTPSAGATQSALAGEDIYSTMMYADAAGYLPDDILVKVDRASMSVALESRVPLLNHHVVELAWQLPLRLKIRGRTGKWLLRQVLKKYLPDSLPVRPKMGFGVPVAEWLRGPLRDWAESLLGEERLRRESFLDPALAREQWARHLAGDSAGGDRVWHMLAFQTWLESIA